MKAAGWLKLDGPCTCSRCGRFVQMTWRYFATAIMWTIAYCEPCAEELLA
jgi:hypothetical protein